MVQRWKCVFIYLPVLAQQVKVQWKKAFIFMGVLSFLETR